MSEQEMWECVDCGQPCEAGEENCEECREYYSRERALHQAGHTEDYGQEE